MRLLWAVFDITENTSFSKEKKGKLKKLVPEVQVTSPYQSDSDIQGAISCKKLEWPIIVGH